jgi:hypothetical protein
VFFRAFAIIVGALLATDGFAAEKAYRIGNSLTWDSQPKAIEALAAQRGLRHSEAYHINCGKSLERIWTNPEEICVKAVAPYGAFRNAFGKHRWHAITLQPFPGAKSTLATDTARILDFIKLAKKNSANFDTVFYIYASWPGQPQGEYRAVWTRETADDDDAKTLQTRDYFAHLIKRVRARTDADVRMIPVGHVLFELDRRMRAGEIDSYDTVVDLYRDKVHLNNVGRYVAGVTTFSTMFNHDPAGLKCPANYYGGGKDFSPELYAQLHDAVWRIITGLHEVTGVEIAK